MNFQQLPKLTCSHLLSVRKFRVCIYSQTMQSIYSLIEKIRKDSKTLGHIRKNLSFTLAGMQPKCLLQELTESTHVASWGAQTVIRPTLNHSADEEVTRAIVDGVFHRRVWLDNFCSAKVLAANDTRIANRRLKDADHVSG